MRSAGGAPAPCERARNPHPPRTVRFGARGNPLWAVGKKCLPITNLSPSARPCFSRFSGGWAPRRPCFPHSPRSGRWAGDPLIPPVDSCTPPPPWTPARHPPWGGARRAGPRARVGWAGLGCGAGLVVVYIPNAGQPTPPQPSRKVDNSASQGVIPKVGSQDRIRSLHGRRLPAETFLTFQKGFSARRGKHLFPGG